MASLKFDKIINLTTSENNIEPLHVNNLCIINEAVDGELVQYFIDGNFARNKRTMLQLANYDSAKWGTLKRRLTARSVSKIGVKAFPGVGSIAHFKYLYNGRSMIICPVNNNNKTKFTSPVLVMQCDADSITFTITPPKDITYECYRIILEHEQFAYEYITYDLSLTVTKPDVKGQYNVYCIGYENEGEAISFDSNILELTITQGQDSFAPKAEIAYYTKEQVDAVVSKAQEISVINHRNVYRGKNLGSSVTAAQKAAIQAGTFNDLFIGDYWVINGVTWVIADMDYFYDCGDNPFTRHHLVIVPNSPLYIAQMNESNVTTGGYVGSKMYTENLNSAKATISAAFGDMVLSHREFLTNAVTDGHPSACGWFDSTVELMNEIMVYGTHIHAPANDGVTIPKRHTVAKQQLALFALNPRAINNRTIIWLRDVVSANYFAFVNSNGLANFTDASPSLGVRPEFCIG